MALSFKPGVRFGNASMAMSAALIVCDQVFMEHGFPCIITSINDSKHGAKSLHYSDRAIDLRIRHLASSELEYYRRSEMIAREIRERLGEDFDVIVEKGSPHIHLEWDPDWMKSKPLIT